MNMRRTLAALLALIMAAGTPGLGLAADPPGPPGPPGSVAPPGEPEDLTPPRVSYLHGDVSFWRPGAADWGPAAMNTPLAPGDTLYASQGGNVEIQVAPRAFVRAGDGTQVGMDNQDADYVQLRVTEGHLAIDVRDLPRGDAIEIGTPSGAFTIERPGFYRLDVSQDSTAFRAHRGGSATVIPAGGSEVEIANNRQVVLVGTDSPRVEAGAAAELSAWDRWNYERTDAVLKVATTRNVPADVYGTEMLNQYGSWRTVETYGSVWVPSRVAADWQPYSTGRWIWDPRYGWTWIDDAPWGWAPYHYGRWVHVSNYWAWAPGPVVVRPVYAPALVVFLGGAVTVGVAARPLCWAPLGWGEPVIPWWGRPAFVGRPYWGGWGGPRVVNNVVIDRSTTVNVTNINVYKNVNVTNAVVGVPADRFGHGHERPVRIAQSEVREFRPVHGTLPVRPVAASLTPATGRAVRPPERVQERPVVVTRPPRDVAPALRSEGLPVERAAAPPARVVPSARAQERVERRERGPAAPGGSASPATEPSRGNDRNERDRAERDAERRGRQAPATSGPEGAQRATPPAAPSPRAVPPATPEPRPEAPRPEPSRRDDRQDQQRQIERQQERADRDTERRGRQTPPPPPGQNGAQRATPPAPSAPRTTPPAPPARPEAPRPEAPRPEPARPSDRNEQRQIEKQQERTDRDADRRGRQTPPPPPGQDPHRGTPPAPPAPRMAPPAPPQQERIRPEAPRPAPPQPQVQPPEPTRPEPRGQERRQDPNAGRMRQAPVPTAPAHPQPAPPPQAPQPPQQRQAPPRQTPPGGGEPRDREGRGERSQRHMPPAAPVVAPRPAPQPAPAIAPRPAPHAAPAVAPRPAPRPVPAVAPRPAPQPAPAVAGPRQGQERREHDNRHERGGR